MALINCPECGKQISDKAQQCISCGYRLNFNNQQQNYYSQQENSRNIHSGTYSEIDYDYEEKGKGSATASLILGLLALFAWFIPLFGYPICIAGIITGGVSLSISNWGRALVGLILSVLGLIGTVINSIAGAIMWSQFFSTHFG